MLCKRIITWLYVLEEGENEQLYKSTGKDKLL